MAKASEGAKLQVHHLCALSDGGDHSIDNLLTLCEAPNYCHLARHGKVSRKAKERRVYEDGSKRGYYEIAA
jgi:5-methylcytosine-specific restriction endonuclease McrA